MISDTPSKDTRYIVLRSIQHNNVFASPYASDYDRKRIDDNAGNFIVIAYATHNEDAKNLVFRLNGKKGKNE